MQCSVRGLLAIIFHRERGEKREEERKTNIKVHHSHLTPSLSPSTKSLVFWAGFFAANSAYNVHRIMASAAAGEGASKCLRLSSLLFYPHSTNFLTNSPEWQFHPRNHNRTASSKIEGSKSDSVNAISCHLSVAVLTVCSALLQAVATSWAS